jgi:hypothetical protein
MLPPRFPGSSPQERGEPYRAAAVSGPRELHCRFHRNDAAELNGTRRGTWRTTAPCRGRGGEKARRHLQGQSFILAAGAYWAAAAQPAMKATEPEEKQ